ncbi:hypothetical protein [Paracraurococcus ruber]|uniref:hypothetical protein n=2 Tax=Paracraurococcus ruber TaxID=77675 RepID=UPI0010576FF7|nr:hypothetical protein [Paracraurococcus ruber]
MLFDNRVQCFSLMTTQSVASYLALVDSAYQNKGSLQFQRDALKTTTGKRIRDRMVEDIKRGTVLPPLVLGLVVSEDFFSKLYSSLPCDIEALVLSAMSQEASIIDGMQRTTALRRAFDEEPTTGQHKIRVECWIARNTDSLIYRMLILNTGQIPWNLKRQLQVVYAPLITEIQHRVNLEKLITIQNPGRRTKGGEFRADDLVETFIAFGLRRTEVDTQEALADEFSRLDIVEAISRRQYNEYFYKVLQLLVDMDRAFSKYKAEEEDVESSEHSDDDMPRRFVKGRNLFDSQPARIGFIVAIAIELFGRPGMDKDDSLTRITFENIVSSCNDFILRVQRANADALEDFLCFGILNEKLVRRQGKYGRHERAYFEKAFRVLLEEKFRVPSMEPCWRA